MKTSHFARYVAGVLAICLVFVSCQVDRAPTAPPPPNADLIGSTVGTVTQTLGTLLSCRPLPYARNSAVIGSGGGSLRIGPHLLVIPSGALRNPTTITGEQPSDSVASVRLFPEGLRFRKSASLALSYSHCAPVSALLPKKVAYTTEGLLILELLWSVDNPLAKTVTGSLDHFSRYAVSY